MPLIIKMRPAGEPKPVRAIPTPELEPVAVYVPPRAYVRPKPVFVPPVLIACRYCGHNYVSGGCNFERQKTCLQHPPGKQRKIAKKSLD